MTQTSSRSLASLFALTLTVSLWSVTIPGQPAAATSPAPHAVPAHLVIASASTPVLM